MNKDLPSNNSLFSGEILDNTHDQQVVFNIDAEVFNISRSLDSIPAWVPEFKMNN